MAAAPPSTRLHLIRHGRVEAPWPERIYGQLDVPLAAEGRAEARRAAESLAGVQLAAVVSSGLARAEYGAELLRAGRGLARRDEPELREIHRGEWAGLSFAELEARQPGAMDTWLADPSFGPPGGESLLQLSDRVLGCVARLAHEFAGDQVAAVCHSWVARVVACRALGLPPQAAVRMSLATGAAVVVDWPASPSGGQAQPARTTEAVGEFDPHPTLVGFAASEAPPRALRWFRGPRR